MTGEVVQLRAVETAAFDFGEMFDSLKARSLQHVLVLTIDDEGKFEWFGDFNAEEANFFLDRAKAWLLKGEDLT